MKREPAGIGAAEIDRHIRGVHGKVQEELADARSFVAQQQHELIHAMRGVDFHDVPEDRLVADGHHGLRDEVGDFAQARAAASA